nr:PREDICTED: alpha-N-acetylgalactosaminide alpha-2,6-sialyltransferase 3 [Opisthocomus hoazin]
MGSAVPCSGAAVELAGTGWNQPCRARGGPDLSSQRFLPEPGRRHLPHHVSNVSASFCIAPLLSPVDARDVCVVGYPGTQRLGGYPAKKLILFCGYISHSNQLRKSIVAVSFIAAFLCLIIVRLTNEVTFPLILNCFGQTSVKWIPFSNGQRQPLRTHYGYTNVKTQEPLQLNCDLCAIVSNSGQMAGQKVGAEIDKSSCIWRMNNAPTKGYEEDVGKRTTIRVVSHTSVPLLLKNPEYFFKETNNTVYVIWGPFRNMRKDGNGIVYNMLKKTVDSYPTAKIYVTTEKRMSYCDAVFKKETGKDRVQSGSYLSTGWFTLILAMDACYGIHVYGMINDTYCKSEGFHKVPYHYYEPGRDECEEYFLHENAPYGGHRFITEKKVFAKWAKKHTIIFTHPNWTVS